MIEAPPIPPCRTGAVAPRARILALAEVTLLLVAVIALAIAFDYINGFHDTANAIATSVATRALSPRTAILMAAAFTRPELVLAPGSEIERRPLPKGYRIRPFDPGTESQQVYQIIEDAFNEWPNRSPSTFQRWKAIVLDRSDFDPRLLFVVLHGSQVVGASLGIMYGDQGWIDQLAVHRDHRNQGIARNLIITTFRQMQSLGASDVRLSTDSRTGALDLYTSLGMEVSKSFTHYSKLLRAA